MPIVRLSTLSSASVVVGVGLGLWASIPLAEGQGARSVPTIAVKDIKEGMEGYGLTVIKGTEPEKFKVKVVTILHNFRPGQELIFVSVDHPRLNITKNVRGMSGSPIFLDGKLAGAYAYSWSTFQVEPIAGVTPIAPMLTEMRRPIPPGFWPLEGAAPLPGKPGDGPRRPHASNTTFEGAPGTYDLEKHAEQVEGRLGMKPVPGRSVVPAATPIMLGGVGDRTAAFVRKMFEPMGLEPMQAGGGGAGSSDGAPLHYVDGGALGVQLARGDVSFMGLGTTTFAEGTRACGFGHPMMNGGDTALPTTIGRVHWIWASDMHSSKIGESARPLGALVQDRQTAVVVDESKTAPVFPISIKIEGAEHAPKSSWQAEIAEERFMTPSIAASAIGAVIEATVSERRDVTWQLKSRVTVRGYPPVDLEDFGVAVGGTPEAPEWYQSRAVRLIGDTLNNPWEYARIEKVEATLKVEYKRDLWRLRGVELLTTEIDAGQKARVRLKLQPFAGPIVEREVEVQVPQELAGKDVEVEIVPGYEIAPETPSPESLRDLLVNYSKQNHLPRSVVLQFRLPGTGLLYRGHVAPRLPAFALDALRPSTTDIVPDAYAIYARTIVPLEKFIEGRDRVRVKVRPIVR